LLEFTAPPKYSKPSECAGCPAEHVGLGYVPGEGPVTACFCFILQSPGAEELLEGRPAIGPTGRTLLRVMHETGHGRMESYVDNVQRCRLPGDAPPSPAMIKFCTERYLFPELRKRSGSIKVLCGGPAISSFTGSNKVEAQRGVFKDHAEFGTWIGTYHPAALMKQQEMFPVFTQDLKAAKQKGSGLYTPAQFTDALYSLKQAPGEFDEFFHEHTDLACDIETNQQLDPRLGIIQLIGFSPLDMPTASMCAPFESQEPLHEEMLREVLSDPTRKKVFHNFNFDGYWLAYNKLPVHGPVYDTMVMSHLLDSTMPNDLEFTAGFHTSLPPWKKLYRAGRESRELYNCKDVHATALSFNVMDKKITAEGMGALLHKILSPMATQLVETRLAGAFVDPTLMAKFNLGLRNYVAKNELLLTHGIGIPWFNFRSPKQLGELLYDKLGLEEQIDRKTHRRTTNEDALEKLGKQRPDLKILQLILDLRGAEKMRSTYASYALDSDFRLHPEVVPTGTVSGRFACREPNLQNVPKNMRRMFIAPPGHLVFSADYKQIEWLISLILAGEHDWARKIIHEGFDFHGHFAAYALKKVQDKITYDERHKAKFVIHGLNYGRGKKSIASDWGVSESIAEHWIEMLWQLVPRVKDWQRANRDEARNRNVLRTVFGRRLKFRFSGGLQADAHTLNQAMSFIPQGTAADILADRGVVKFPQAIKSFARPFIWVHDDTSGYVQEGHLKELNDAAQDILAGPIPELDNWHIPVDVKIGRNWGDYHKDKNPLGLRPIKEILNGDNAA